MTPREYALAVLYLPVPPRFDKVCGYPGSARFVTFHWSASRDWLIYDDNLIRGCGEWEGYLLYIQQPKVEQLLRGFSLGSSQDKARHALVLDRLIPAVYVGHRQDVQRFLEAVQPKSLDRLQRGESCPSTNDGRQLVDKWEQLQEIRRWIALNL